MKHALEGGAMKDLVERLEAGETGREMDAEIARAFGLAMPIPFHHPNAADPQHQYYVTPSRNAHRDLMQDPPNLTGSHYLADRLFNDEINPWGSGKDWTVTEKADTFCKVEIYQRTAGEPLTLCSGIGATPAAALIAALLRAKDAP